MAKKTADRIEDALNSMDSSELIQIIHILQEEIGDRKLWSIIKTLTTAKADFDPKTISKKAKECTDMDEDEWYSIADVGEFGEYVYPIEHAAELMLDNLRAEFRKDLERMVAAGYKDKASEYLVAIADGFAEGDGILADECPDFPSEFSEHLRKCAENQDFDNALKW